MWTYPQKYNSRIGRRALQQLKHSMIRRSYPTCPFNVSFINLKGMEITLACRRWFVNSNETFQLPFLSFRLSNPSDADPPFKAGLSLRLKSRTGGDTDMHSLNSKFPLALRTKASLVRL